MADSSTGVCLVTGANGRTGRAVVAALARAGARVRGLIRDPAQQQALGALGVDEFAVGDMMDAPSLSGAVQGAETVVHIGPPMHPHEVEITDRLLGAARDHGVKHFVYYSVMHPLRRDVRHHRLKLEAEEHVVESGIPYTIVQPCRYMQHLEAIWPKVTEDGVHAMPFDVTRRFSVVDLIDLADAVAKVVTEPGHLYATYELAGPEPLSQEQMAERLAKQLGRPVKARAVALDDMERVARSKGLPDDKVEQMRIMNGHYDRFGFEGNANVLGWLLGREPVTYDAYIERLARR